MYIALFSVAVLGAIAGSFINALVFRFHSGESMVGRSHCMSCKHTLSALDLVPFFSFAFLRGKCRYCGVPISIQYPLVELVGAMLSLGVFFINPLPLPFLLGFFFWMTILFAAAYDLKFQELPNNALMIGGMLGFLSIFMHCGLYSCTIISPTLTSLFSGPLVALPLLAISAFSRERAMGWGDGLFMLGFGWLLGLTGGFSALCIGVWTGAAAGVLMIIWQKFFTVHTNHSVNDDVRVTMKTRIPFAPFLALGAIAVYFLHANFLTALLAL